MANPQGVDDGRQRMYYTHDEDLRQVSAWLNNSTDPIEGNARKGDTYWKQVTTAYNSTTPDARKREMLHLKGHWHRTTKKVIAFNGCYIQLRDVYQSGRSDDQMMDQAHELYRERQGHPFAYTHWWKAVCDSPKWNVHISSLGGAPSRISHDLDVNAPPTEAPAAQERPMGIKRAKKAKEAAGSVELKKMVKSLVGAHASGQEELDGMKDFQQRLSDQKVETANLQLLAAQEKTKAKMIDHQTKLLDKFTEMLAVDTSNMEPWAKEAHIKACTLISDQLWGKGASVE